MSGFFGIFRPQGGSVDLDAFEQMRKATEREGFDGLDTHVEEKVAMGHLMLRVSPEAKYDQQPLHSECGRYLMVGHFRLDYRDELGDKLGLTQSELELTPDSRLVMLAYQKWKDQCVYHIEGDSAFAVFDSSSNSLLLAKDRTGYSALFYTQYKDAIYFSSDVNVIGSIETIPFEVDMVQFYRLSLPSILVEKGKTLLKEVYHLNGGNYIKFANDSKITVFKYWDKANVNSILYSDNQDYAENMRSIFTQAVKSRLREEVKTGIFLSAGLDSMAVASCLAAEIEVKNKKIYSFTSYPYHLDKIDASFHNVLNEVPLVQKFVERNKNIVAKYMNFPKVKIEDFFKSHLTMDLYSPIISSNTFWVQGIFKEAKDMNIRRIFNGQVGNMTISFNAPFIQLDMLFSGNFKECKKDFFDIRKNRLFSNYQVLKLFFFIPGYKVLKSYINSRKIFKAKHRSLSILKSNHDLKDKKNRLTINRQEFIPNYYFFRSSQKLQIDQLERYVDFAGMKWYKDSFDFAIESLDPTSDSRLINFVLSLPSSQFNKGGVSKFIYKNFMKGYLDDEILNNPRSMQQSSDIKLRVQSSQTFALFISELQKSIYNKPILNEFDLEFSYKTLVNNDINGLNNSDFVFLLKKISLINWIVTNKKYNFTNN